MKNKIKTIKAVPFFKPFKTMEQGLEAILPVIDKMSNDDPTKCDMLMVYGSLIETHNQIVREGWKVKPSVINNL